jgi:hypothetical protein
MITKTEQLKRNGYYVASTCATLADAKREAAEIERSAEGHWVRVERTGAAAGSVWELWVETDDARDAR